MKQTIFLLLAISLLLIFPYSAECSDGNTSSGLLRAESMQDQDPFEYAPENPPYLVSISISGTSELIEGFAAVYDVIAYYSNGATEEVSNDTYFSQNSPYASVSGNVLYTEFVTGNQTGQLTAYYQGKSDSISFTIIDFQ